MFRYVFFLHFIYTIKLIKLFYWQYLIRCYFEIKKSACQTVNKADNELNQLNFHNFYTKIHGMNFSISLSLFHSSVYIVWIIRNQIIWMNCNFVRCAWAIDLHSLSADEHVHTVLANQ